MHIASRTATPRVTFFCLNRWSWAGYGRGEEHDRARLQLEYIIRIYTVQAVNRNTY